MGRALKLPGLSVLVCRGLGSCKGFVWTFPSERLCVASFGKAGAGSRDSHPTAEWGEGKPLFEKKAKVDLVLQYWFCLFNQPAKPNFQLMRLYQEPGWFPKLIPPPHSHEQCAEEDKWVTKKTPN